MSICTGAGSIMEINKSIYVESELTGVVNNAAWVLCEWKYEKGIKLSSLEIFKKVFGKQLLTKNYSCRNWIWSFSEGGNVLWCFVSKEGVSFNCDFDADKVVINEMIDEVVKMIKMYSGEL